MSLAGRFVLPDGRKISISPDAVTAVYEQQASSLTLDYKDGKWSSEEPRSTVIAIGQTNLVVPYTHDEVMLLLYPDSADG